MRSPTFASPRPASAAWASPGAHAASPVLEVPVSRAGAGVPAQVAAAPRPLWRRALRVVRDLAIGLAVVAAIPLTLIQVAGVRPLFSLDVLRERIVEAGRLRVLTAPVDPTVTPEAAGAALNRLLPAVGTADVPTRAAVSPEIPWRSAPLPEGLFVGKRSVRWAGPESMKIITAARDLSAAERAWLATVAAAPLWRDADLVARARTVDITGQRYVLPFSAAASDHNLPFVNYTRSAEFAHASVARAAYYVAIGDEARAEAALRTVVSLGFALLDNSLIGIDGMIGRTMVEVGRDGFRQLDAVRGRHDRDAITASAPRRVYTGPMIKPTRDGLARLRTTAIADLANPSLPLSFRGDQLSMLAWSDCGSLTRVLLGPDAATRTAMAQARATLARTDAERQLLEVMLARPDVAPQRSMATNALAEVLEGAAAVTSAVTGNARIASCTRAVIGTMMPR